MAATTIDALVDRVRDVLEDAPFAMSQGMQPWTFRRDPQTAIAATSPLYRVDVTPGRSLGAMNFRDDRTDYVTVVVAAPITSTPVATYDRLLALGTSITAAITRDAHEQSGEYAVLDEGSVGPSVSAPQGADYLELSVRLALNYERQL